MKPLSYIKRLIHEHKRKMHIQLVIEHTDSPEVMRFMNCGWCGAKTFIWMQAHEMIPPSEWRTPSWSAPLLDHCNRPFSPYAAQAQDTTCTNCKMGLRDWFDSWFKVEFFTDGCKTWFDGEGQWMRSGGPKHAPHHYLYPDDTPVHVIERNHIPIPPIIDSHNVIVGYFGPDVIRELMGSQT